MKDKEAWLRRNKDKFNFNFDTNDSIQYNILRKLSKKKDLRKFFHRLSKEELFIWFACQLYSFRECKIFFRKSHEYIRQVYIRACKKLSK